MPSSNAAYFSHSWSPQDLTVNVMLWEHISRACHLVIDQPQPSSEEDRPYFISRLESIMRHADVFLCALPALPPEKQSGRNRSAMGDWRFHKCSPYILFEIRLAERLDLPRFVLFDRHSGFRPPANCPRHVRYVARDFAELQTLTEAGRLDEQLIAEIEDWLKWVSISRVPNAWTIPTRTACLFSQESSFARTKLPVLLEAVDEAGFEPPEQLTSAFHTDAELYQLLRAVGLLIVDISQHDLLPLYHAAHSLMIPTIRISSKPNDQLPALLQGHPAGYQLDVLEAETIEKEELLYTRVLDRSVAISRAARPVVSREEGIGLLHQRTYHKKHFVFISHDEKLDDRELVDATVSRLKACGVSCWEYAVENRSGELWRSNMADALNKTTLMVVLLSPKYELSTGCMDEWEHAINNQIPLLPFLTRGRTSPSRELRRESIAHPQLTDSSSINERAEQIVSSVVNALRT